MEKTLKEFLTELEPETDICIGADNGHGFMFFGKASEIEEIQKAFDTYRTKKKKNTIPKCKSCIKASIKTVNLSDDASVLSHANEIAKYYHMFENTERYLKNYVDPMNRKVIKEYDKEVDPCLCIIIEGSEEGKWLKEEFKKGS